MGAREPHQPCLGWSPSLIMGMEGPSRPSGDIGDLTSPRFYVHVHVVRGIAPRLSLLRGRRRGRRRRRRCVGSVLVAAFRRYGDVLAGARAVYIHSLDAGIDIATPFSPVTTILATATRGAPVPRCCTFSPFTPSRRAGAGVDVPFPSSPCSSTASFRRPPAPPATPAAPFSATSPSSCDLLSVVLLFSGRYLGLAVFFMHEAASKDGVDSWRARSPFVCYRYHVCYRHHWLEGKSYRILCSVTEQREGERNQRQP